MATNLKQSHRLADIHYYFQTPTPKPQSHRFEKSSYLYIYQDATQSKARLEIANNPGTEDQDAFAGSLGNIHIHHSTEFPTLCTVTVDGLTGAPENGASQHDWLLPSDQNEWRRIHTIDIYFWTLEDANQFLDTASHVLAKEQVDTDREVVEQTDQPLSSVVQQLESIAVSDPAYQNGQTRDSQANPTAIAASPASTQATPETLSFPPPPPPPGAPSSNPIQQERQASPEKPAEPENTAPLPYNPAAPAAPEFIKHREKTPPPPEEGEGAGLPFNPHQPNIGMSSFAPPPTSTPGMPYSTPAAQPAQGYASPPPSAGLSHAHTFSMGSGSALQSPTLPTYQQSFLTGQTVPNNGMSFAPPPQDPNAHLYAQQGYGMQQQQMGYNNPYEQQQPPQPLQRSNTEYDIHSQVYRPTMDEVHSHAQKTARKSMKAPGQRPHAIEDKAHKMESGVNRFLKRLEKKIG